MALTLKLFSENPNDFEDIEIVEEQSNLKGQSNLFITGKMIGTGIKNKNGRVYVKDEIRSEVDRYITEMVNPGRAMGELGHPSNAEIDLGRACHLITQLNETNEGYSGKAKVLSTPTGQLLRSLINDGVKIGVSTRALGNVQEESVGNVVKNMYLVAIDAVADPSYPDAFVNGILESKSWVMKTHGQFEEKYDKFENSLKSMPSKERDFYLREQILKFVDSLGRF